MSKSYSSKLKLFVVIALFFISLVIYYYIIATNPKTNYARCAWLPSVPVNWTCFDKWNQDTRHLIASNPKNSNEYLELEIEGKNGTAKLDKNCSRILPIGLPVIVSYSSLTTPYLCKNNSQLLIQSEWTQDSFKFRLTGNISLLGIYLSNLDMHGGMYNPPNIPLTTNYLYTIKLTQVFLKSNEQTQIDFTISNTNLCNDPILGLKEIPIVTFVEDQFQLKILGNEPYKKCEIIAVLPVSDSEYLKPGSYHVTIEINGLKQLMKDKIEIIENSIYKKKDPLTEEVFL